MPEQKPPEASALSKAVATSKLAAEIIDRLRDPGITSEKMLAFFGTLKRGDIAFALKLLLEETLRRHRSRDELSRRVIAMGDRHGARPDNTVGEIIAMGTAAGDPEIMEIEELMCEPQFVLSEKESKFVEMLLFSIIESK